MLGGDGGPVYMGCGRVLASIDVPTEQGRDSSHLMVRQHLRGEILRAVNARSCCHRTSISCRNIKGRSRDEGPSEKNPMTHPCCSCHSAPGGNQPPLQSHHEVFYYHSRSGVQARICRGRRCQQTVACGGRDQGCCCMCHQLISEDWSPETTEGCSLLITFTACERRPASLCHGNYIQRRWLRFQM